MAVEDQQGFYPERHPDDGDCDTWRDLAEVVQGDGAPEDQTELLSPIILHVDVDSFYCEVERMDDPSLRGKPLAVQQFNSGGFVAVSYEAKAAGVKKGDGVGAAGRANIETLKEIGAVSMEEARRRCPGLVVKPMRTERYREVALRMQVWPWGCPPPRSFLFSPSLPPHIPPPSSLLSPINYLLPPSLPLISPASSLQSTVSSLMSATNGLRLPLIHNLSPPSSPLPCLLPALTQLHSWRITTPR